MPRSPLEPLLRIRRMAQDEAAAALSGFLQAETDAENLAKQADRQIAAETAAASALDGDDSVVEAFAAWLPGARHRAAQAHVARERAAADVARARAALTMARAGREAVAALIAERASAQAAAAVAHEQNALDDATRGCSTDALQS
jgi:hypothetical protein